MNSLDTSIYDKYGLKVGLEIHFQLDTGRKLFCRCPVGLVEDIHGLEFIRRLRPTQSELGQIDPAAYFEFKKGLYIKYIAPMENTCLVEADEEPPHPMDLDALETALKVASYFKSTIVDEVHVMRKIVIDGSNTTGFQRTAIVAMGGYIDVESIGKRVPIQTICLEEEAARLVKREDNYVIYSLDRLGTPLIEIATAPVIHSPEEAYEVALSIGRIIAATGRKRRGIGSVRQDINISVLDGNVVEVKGVQKLSQLKKVIEFEFKRQVGLYEISLELKNRGVSKDDILDSKIDDVTDIFENCRNRVIRRGLKRGDRVVAVLLKGFAGLIKKETAPGYWLGKEFVERVRFWTGIRGIFHTDELPSYGISKEEVVNLMDHLGAGDSDAIVFVVGPERLAYDAIGRVVERAAEALDGVPAETRGSRGDGKTFYMRPRPGMARMYPETDIPPIRITNELMRDVVHYPIKDPGKIVGELMDRFGISEDLAWKLYDNEYVGIFELIMDRAEKIPASYVASFLTDTLRYLEREGIDLDKIGEGLLLEAFSLVDRDVIEKESIQDIIKLCVDEGVSVQEAIERLGLLKIKDITPIKKELLSIYNEREDIRGLPIELRKKRLMAIIMSKYRGKVDPKDILKIIEEVVGDG